MKFVVSFLLLFSCRPADPYPYPFNLLVWISYARGKFSCFCCCCFSVVLSLHHTCFAWCNCLPSADIMQTKKLLISSIFWNSIPDCLWNHFYKIIWISLYLFCVCFFLFCRLKRPHLDYVCNMRDFNSYLFLLFRCIFVCLLFLLSSDWNWPMPLLRCRQYMFSDSYCSDPVNSIPTGLLSLSYYSWKIWKYNGNHWLFVVFISIFPSCLSA